MNKLERLLQDFNEVQIKVNSLGARLQANLPPNVTPLSPRSTNFQPIPVIPPPSTSNQIRNGDFSHSVNTWFDAVPAPGTDLVLECAWWYSNDPPTPGQQLDFANAETTPINQELKMVGHSTYDPAYSDWDANDGIGRFQGLTTIDAPFPINSATPGKVESLGFIAAKRGLTGSSEIVVPNDCLLYVGIWDNTTGQLDWLQGTPFGFKSNSGTVGTPGATTERRYKIFAKTDKGYSFLSTELVVADAPLVFDSSVAVFLSWDSIPGILEYDIYRHDVSAGLFRILEAIGNGGTNYSDNGSININSNAGGYPTATNSASIAYVATSPGDLVGTAIDGVAAQWSSYTMNVAIPVGYNQSLTTGQQVLRLGLTKALDRVTFDAVVINGDNTVTSADGDFTSDDVGRTVFINTDFETTIASVTSPTEIELTDAPDFDATDAELYIEEGGDHGLLIDLCYLSYVPGSAYAAYSDDLNRALQPTAMPDGTNQGGAVGGGSGSIIDPGDGGRTCVTMDTLISVMLGERLRAVPYVNILRGDALYGGDLQCNIVMDLTYGTTDDLHIVRTYNGVQLRCSPSHKLITSRADAHGRAVKDLRAGEYVLTTINGRVERSRIKSIIATGEKAKVGTVMLGPGKIYGAGERYERNWLDRVIMRVKRALGREDVVSILSHNVKNEFGQFQE